MSGRGNMRTSTPRAGNAVVMAALAALASVPVFATPSTHSLTGSRLGQAALARPFLLAASGWNSALVPIARFTGSTWVNTWPEPAEADVPVPKIENVPLAWLGQPVPRQWTLFLEGRPTRITVTSTRRGDRGGCTSPAVLAIDRPPVVPDTAYDGGLAVDTGQIVEDVHRLMPADAQWRLVAPIAERTYGQYESRALGGGDQGWFADALVRGRVDLASRPMTVDAIYQPITDLSQSTFYFVARKRFVADNREYGIVVSGWLRSDAGGRWPAMAVNAHAFGDDVPGEGLLPLGLLRVINRRFWVMFATGWESGAFEIHEATGTEMIKLMTSSNGGC